MRQVKNIEFAKEGRTIIVNDKYEIDTQDGGVYYAWCYDGNRNKDFPQWIFKLRDRLQVQGLVK